MNFGFPLDERMERLPEWYSVTGYTSVPVTHDNKLIFNAHALGTSKRKTVIGLVKRTHEEGLSVFLHRPETFEGIVPRPEVFSPELSTLRFTTIIANQHDVNAMVYAEGAADPICYLEEYDTQIVSLALTRAAMNILAIQTEGK